MLKEKQEFVQQTKGKSSKISDRPVTLNDTTHAVLGTATIVQLCDTARWSAALS